MDMDLLTEAVARGLGADPNVAAVYLFGSQARGTARATSDVDLGVVYLVPPPRTLLGQPFDVEDALTAELGRPAQVVVLNDAPADLVHRVLRDGVLLFEGDRAVRVAFEVRRRAEYFDLLPVLRQYRRAG